jgi:hypothetical protein
MEPRKRAVERQTNVFGFGCKDGLLQTVKSRRDITADSFRRHNEYISYTKISAKTKELNALPSTKPGVNSMLFNEMTSKFRVITHENHPIMKRWE